MKKIIFSIIFFGLFINKNVSGDIIMENLKNNLFGYSTTVWIKEGINDKYNYFYQLSFEWGGTNPDNIYFMYFTQEDIDIPPKIKIYRKGSFLIENNIVKINFTQALYNVWNTFNYPFIEEDLVVGLCIKIENENNKNYADKIIVTQVFGKNIFEDFKANEKIIFEASRMIEKI